MRKNIYKEIVKKKAFGYAVAAAITLPVFVLFIAFLQPITEFMTPSGMSGGDALIGVIVFSSLIFTMIFFFIASIFDPDEHKDVFKEWDEKVALEKEVEESNERVAEQDYYLEMRIIQFYQTLGLGEQYTECSKSYQQK